MPAADFSANIFIQPDPASLVGLRQSVQQELNKVTIGNFTGNAAPRAAVEGVDSITRSIRLATEAQDKFAERTAFSAARLAAYLIPAGIIFKLSSAFDTATSSIVQFNTATNKLTQILDGNSVRANKLADDVLKIAEAYGQSGKEILEVTNILAQNSTKFSSDKSISNAVETISKANLTGTFKDIKVAVEGGISALNQFNLSGDRFTDTMDTITNLSQKFGVSSDELAQAIEKGGSAFKEAGGNLKEYLALVTTLNQITKLPGSRIGVGLRSLAQNIDTPDAVDFTKRLTGGKTEDVSGNLLSIGQRIKAIADATKGFNSEQLSVVIDKIGGRDKASILLPLLQNVNKTKDGADLLAKALDAANNSSGTLSRDAVTGLNRIDVQLASIGSRFSQLFNDIGQDQGIQNLVKEFASMAKFSADIVDKLTPFLPSLVRAAGALVALNVARGISNGSFATGISRFVNFGTNNPRRSGGGSGGGFAPSIAELLGGGGGGGNELDFPSIGGGSFSSPISSISRIGRSGPFRSFSLPIFSPSDEGTFAAANLARGNPFFEEIRGFQNQSGGALGLAHSEQGPLRFQIEQNARDVVEAAKQKNISIFGERALRGAIGPDIIPFGQGFVNQLSNPIGPTIPKTNDQISDAFIQGPLSKTDIAIRSILGDFPFGKRVSNRNSPIPIGIEPIGFSSSTSDILNTLGFTESSSGIPRTKNPGAIFRLKQQRTSGTSIGGIPNSLSEDDILGELKDPFQTLQSIQGRNAASRAARLDAGKNIPLSATFSKLIVVLEEEIISIQDTIAENKLMLDKKLLRTKTEEEFAAVEKEGIARQEQLNAVLAARIANLESTQSASIGSSVDRAGGRPFFLPGGGPPRDFSRIKNGATLIGSLAGPFAASFLLDSLANDNIANSSNSITGGNLGQIIRNAQLNANNSRTASIQGGASTGVNVGSTAGFFLGTALGVGPVAGSLIGSAVGGGLGAIGSGLFGESERSILGKQLALAGSSQINLKDVAKLASLSINGKLNSNEGNFQPFTDLIKSSSDHFTGKDASIPFFSSARDSIVGAENSFGNFTQNHPILGGLPSLALKVLTSGSGSKGISGSDLSTNTKFTDVDNSIEEILKTDQGKALVQKFQTFIPGIESDLIRSGTSRSDIVGATGASLRNQIFQTNFNDRLEREGLSGTAKNDPRRLQIQAEEIEKATILSNKAMEGMKDSIEASAKAAEESSIKFKSAGDTLLVFSKQFNRNTDVLSGLVSGKSVNNNLNTSVIGGLFGQVSPLNIGGIGEFVNKKISTLAGNLNITGGNQTDSGNFIDKLINSTGVKLNPDEHQKISDQLVLSNFFSQTKDKASDKLFGQDLSDPLAKEQFGKQFSGVIAEQFNTFRANSPNLSNAGLNTLDTFKSSILQSAKDNPGAVIGEFDNAIKALTSNLSDRVIVTFKDLEESINANVQGFEALRKVQADLVQLQGRSTGIDLNRITSNPLIEGTTLRSQLSTFGGGFSSPNFGGLANNVISTRAGLISSKNRLAQGLGVDSDNLPDINSEAFKKLAAGSTNGNVLNDIKDFSNAQIKAAKASDDFTNATTQSATTLNIWKTQLDESTKRLVELVGQTNKLGSTGVGDFNQSRAQLGIFNSISGTRGGALDHSIDELTKNPELLKAAIAASSGLQSDAAEKSIQSSGSNFGAFIGPGDTRTIGDRANSLEFIRGAARAQQAGLSIDQITDAAKDRKTIQDKIFDVEKDMVTQLTILNGNIGQILPNLLGGGGTNGPDTSVLNTSINDLTTAINAAKDRSLNVKYDGNINVNGISGVAQGDVAVATVSNILDNVAKQLDSGSVYDTQLAAKLRNAIKTVNSKDK